MKKNMLFSRKCRLLVILFTVMFLQILSLPAFCAEGPVAKLTSFSGTLLIKSQGEWGVQPKAELSLYSGDKLVTKLGEAVITFNDGAVMEIKPNSNLLVQESEEEEGGMAQGVKTAKRRLRLLLGKMFFKTGRGSNTKTTLETTTMVCGLRGTAGVISIDAEGQTYIQFTEGGGDTVGNIISGVAQDVPAEIADLNPAQRAAFVAVAAAQQAASASERAATGDIGDAEAALAQAQAAEAAAQEAKTAAEQMLTNPDPTVQNEAAQAISAAEAAIDAAKEVQEQARESGATGTGASGGEGGGDDGTGDGIVTEGDTTVGNSPPAGGPGMGEPLPGVSSLFDVDTNDLSGDKDSDLSDEDRRATVTTPPYIKINEKPGLYTNSSYASFVIESDANKGGSYRLDGGEEVIVEAHSAEESGQLYFLELVNLSEGSHKVEFTAFNEGGTSATKSHSWTVDWTPPEVNFSSAPSAIDNLASFGISAQDTNSDAGLTYMYSLDEGSTWIDGQAALDLGLATDGSADGGYYILVKAVDAAGNVSDPIEYSWTYDTTAPAIAVNTPPESLTDITETSFSVTHTNSEPGGVTYTYSLDGSAVESTSLAGLGDGTHSFEIVAKDEAGNTSTSAITWEIDTLAPTALAVAKATSSEKIDFTLSSTDANPGSYTWKLFDGSGTELESGEGETATIVIDSLENGSYTFEWTATDALGHSTSGEEVVFTFDTYQMAGGNVSGTGSVITGTAEGQLSIAGGDDWGDRSVSTEMTGTWSGEHTGSLSLASGGPASGSTDSGLWLSTTTGTITGTDATGQSNYTMLTPTTLVTGDGTFTGTFATDNTWTGTESASDLLYTNLTFSSVFTGSEGGFLSRMFDGTLYEGFFSNREESFYEVMGGDYEYAYLSVNNYFDFSLDVPSVITGGTILFGERSAYIMGYEHDETYFPYGGAPGTGILLAMNSEYYLNDWEIGGLESSLFTNPTDLGIDLSTGWTVKESEMEMNILARSGYFSGIMGGTGDPLSGSASISLLGEYSPWDGDYTKASLFNTGIISSDATSGMAYAGFMFGAIDPSMMGKIYALYVSEDGSGGILEGDFTGTAYPEIGMWNGAGSIIGTQKREATGLTVDSFMDSLGVGVLTGWLGGDFGASGSYIRSEYGMGKTAALSGNESFGIFSFSEGVSNSYYNPSSSTAWTGRAGGFILPVDSYGASFWITDEISGSASQGIISADFTGKTLSLTHYSDIAGSLIGSYDETGSGWQAQAGGYWHNSAPLHLGGEIVTDLGITGKVFTGYASGSEPYENFSYEYSQLGGTGFSTLYNSETGYSSTTYNPDGTYVEAVENSDGSITYNEGVWGESGSNLLEYLEAKANTHEMTESFESYNMEYTGSMDGVMGGLDPVWSATSAAPANIVMMGELDMDYNYNSVFNGRIQSINPWDGSNTLWSQADSAVTGAYSGYNAGISLAGADKNTIEGNILALYVDDSGNAGYLRGNYDGSGYSNSWLWEATGTLYPEQMTTGVNIAPANFTTANGWGRALIQGRLGETGSVSGADPGIFIESDSSNLETMSIIDETNGISLPWGIFSGHYNGSFENPENASSWTSITGGDAEFGSYFDSEDYIHPDRGFYIADASSLWSDGKVGAALDGSFITETKAGLMKGEILGTYDDVGKTWQAASLGTYSGEDLSFHSRFISSIIHAVNAYSGEYSFSGGGSSTFWYLEDNSEGMATYYFTSGDFPNRKIWYDGDGTFYMETRDAEGNLVSETYDTWDPATQNLGDLVANPAPPTGETAELVFSDTRIVEGYSSTMRGYFGGTESLWSGSDIPVTLMGELRSDYYSPVPASIWAGRLESRNSLQRNFTTYDGGSYYGSMAGIRNNDNLQGLLAAIYIAPDGSAGYLKGQLSGGIYSGIDMFDMNGTINRTGMISNSGILPSDLGVNLTDMNFDMLESYGDFNGSGSIATPMSGYSDSNVWSITAIEGQQWGIFQGIMMGSFDNPEEGTTWKSKTGDEGWSYSGDSIGEYGYFIGDNSGTWENGVLSSALTGRILTDRVLGNMTGDTLGTYRGTTEGLWEAVSLGTWVGEELKYTGEIDTDINHTVKKISGDYYTTTGTGSGYYHYWYHEDNSAGYLSYTDPVTGVTTQKTYSGNGGLIMYDSFSEETTFGTWNPAAENLSTLIAGTPPEIAEYEWSGNVSDYITPFSYGFLEGIFGGTESLWSGSDVPITLMGSYSGNVAMGSIWSNDIYSYNYDDSTYTDYEGGAWYGNISGIKNSEDLEGMVSAIYIAPDGSAGYLTGSTTGSIYPEIGMFEMDGTIDRIKKSADVNIAPEYLEDYLSEAWGSLRLAGSFNGTGFLSDEVDEGYEFLLEPYPYYGSDYLFSGIAGQKWGIYSGEMFGTFENPMEKTSWNSRLGGYSSFSGELLRTYVSGENNQSGEGAGSVLYRYFDDNTQGYRAFVDTDENYYIHYYGDGTWSGYDNIAGADISGTWDPQTENLVDIVTAVPTAWGSEWSNDWQTFEPYYNDHSGYIVANTSSNWTDGRLSADVSGRFMSETLLGEISGDILGTYSGTTEGLWEAVNLGAWSGTELKFAGNMGSYISHGSNYFSGSYYSGSGLYDYYYYGDNTAGYVELTDPETGKNTRIYYYSDGTTETWDSITGKTTYGTWNPEVDRLASLINTTPPVVPGYTWDGSSDFSFSRLESGNMEGLMGGTGSLWTGIDVPVTIMGEYNNGDYSSSQGIWSSAISSRNFKESESFITYDGGAYFGSMGGIVLKGDTSDILKAGISAMYIDPDGKTGYLAGKLSGSGYQDIEMFEMDGTINRIEMGTTLTPAAQGYSAVHYGHYLELNGAGDFAAGGSIGLHSSFAQSFSLVDAAHPEFEYWGIIEGTLLGDYNGAVSDTWKMELTDSYGYEWIGIDGTKWSDGEISADISGAWVTIDTAQTGILGGELFGTFDPVAFTWESITTGSWMETNRFLAMADPSNPAGNAALQALNIPCIEIGRTDLSYSSGGTNLTGVNMTDVIFFAYSTGDAPRIWATGNVTGETNGISPAGETATLTGTGFDNSVDFTINNYGPVNGTWDASVSGAGIVGGHNLDINGAAAGSVDSTASFSGTAAGVSTLK